MTSPTVKQIKNKPRVYAQDEYVDAVLGACQEEVARSAAAFENVKKQFFVSTATDMSKAFWLEAFDLSASDKWKPAVLAALRRRGTLTEVRLKEFIAAYTELVADVDFEVEVAHADYEVSVNFLSEVPATVSIEQLETLLRALIPAHLSVKVERYAVQ